MSPKEFYDNLTKAEKNIIVGNQMELCYSGKHKGADFVQRECWIEAVGDFANKVGVEIDWSKMNGVNELRNAEKLTSRFWVLNRNSNASFQVSFPSKKCLKKSGGNFLRHDKAENYLFLESFAF